MNKSIAVDIGNTFLGTNSNLGELETVGSVTSNIISASISIAGVILLFILILGGIGIISGAGSNDPQKLEKGKKAATSALIGFIVVFSAYWIVKLVEYVTGLSLLQ